MKEIRAYVQPFVLGRLIQALAEIPEFPGVSVSDCEGFGRDRVLPGQEFTPLLPKKRLEIFASDDQVELIVEAIMSHAHTGRPGDGKLYVSDVLEGGRIRTQERGPDLT